MITLYEFLRIMSLDSELEIFGEEAIDPLIAGKRGEVDIPLSLYDTPVTYFVPGIVTKIFIKESKY